MHNKEFNTQNKLEIHKQISQSANTKCRFTWISFVAWQIGKMHNRISYNNQIKFVASFDEKVSIYAKKYSQCTIKFLHQRISGITRDNVAFDLCWIGPLKKRTMFHLRSGRWCEEIIQEYFRQGFSYQEIPAFLSKYHGTVIWFRTLNTKLRGLPGVPKRTLPLCLNTTQKR